MKIDHGAFDEHVYEVGDVVTISPDLFEGDHFANGEYEINVNNMMSVYSGRQTVITGIVHSIFGRMDRYRIGADCGRWVWNDLLFDHSGLEIEEVPEGEFDRLLGI